MNKEQWAVLRQVIGYIRRYRGMMGLSLGLCLVTVAAALYVPVLTGQAIDLMLGPGQVAWAQLPPLLLQMALVVAIAAIAQWGMGLCNNRMTLEVVRQVRCDAFAHIQRLPLSALDQIPTGEWVSRVIADVDQFADGLLLGFSQLFSATLTIIGTLVIMFLLQPLIAMAVVVITPISLVVAAVIARRSYALFARQSQARGRQTAFVEEMVSHQKVVRAFSREEKVRQRFDELNDQLEESSREAIFISSITNPSTRFVNALVFACVGVAGAMVAITFGGITVGQLACFLSYANQYTRPFNEISGVVTELQNALVCARRVFELIQAPAEEPDAPNAACLTQPEGNVVFQDVSFSYRKDRPLIEGFSLEAAQGQRIAIVGPTGCGKTTLINLLMRFYDVDSGAVLVSGRNIQGITRASLRRSFGMVLQDTWLKTGTVQDNITMGKEDATGEEVVAAAKRTHAHGFIQRLPNGYDTVISEDGRNLSQGQRQLLCITRVMLTLPPMLILDEATSSIDTRTELEVQAAFDQLMQGRTSFVVAHRLSTIQHADQILMMGEGRILERGTHGKLLAQGGPYARLYQSQFASADK